MSGHRRSVIACVFTEVRKFFKETPPEEMGTEVPQKNFAADTRLWRARKGIGGSYKLYLEPNEKVIFNLWSYVDPGSGRRRIEIFPASYYKDNKLVMRASRFFEDERRPFLSGGVLFHSFDVGRIPSKYRKEFKLWALLIMDGVKKYDDKARALKNLAHQ